MPWLVTLLFDGAPRLPLNNATSTTQDSLWMRAPILDRSRAATLPSTLVRSCSQENDAILAM